MSGYKYSLEIMEDQLTNKFICPEIKYAFKTSIEALEKQIEKQVISTESSSQTCPGCGAKVNYKYCPGCGQKLKY